MKRKTKKKPRLKLVLSPEKLKYLSDSRHLLHLLNVSRKNADTSEGDLKAIFQAQFDRLTLQFQQLGVNK